MNVLETDWWSLALPPEFWAENEDDTIVIGDRDDVGCIEISTLQKERGEFSSPELRSIAQEEFPDVVAWEACELGELVGWYAEAEEDDAALRIWWVASGGLMLFVTYSCDVDNAGMDDAAVDDLLDTLLLRAAEPAS